MLCLWLLSGKGFASPCRHTNTHAHTPWHRHTNRHTHTSNENTRLIWHFYGFMPLAWPGQSKHKPKQSPELSQGELNTDYGQPNTYHIYMLIQTRLLFMYKSKNFTSQNGRNPGRGKKLPNFNFKIQRQSSLPWAVGQMSVCPDDSTPLYAKLGQKKALGMTKAKWRGTRSHTQKSSSFMQISRH